ncbi:MAG: hypothetical protein RR295_06145 [Oscillospiraceae bacterium]
MGGLARVDSRRWAAFWEQWEKSILSIPGAKRDALEAAGEAVKQRLDAEIATRHVGSHGRVQTWQASKVGSGGGYTAVSAIPGEVIRVSKSGKKTTAAQVTKYLEHGHPTRSGHASKYADAQGLVRYSASTGKAIVPGRQFYSWTRLYAGQIGREAAAAILEQIKKEWES